MATPNLHLLPTGVICPSWCARTRREHLDELALNGGVVIHLSAYRHGSGWQIQLSSCSHPDGTPADEPPEIHVVDASVTPAAARELAAAIVQAADQLDGRDA